MKYYYISHDGTFKNRVILGKDTTRIIRDENKILVTRINDKFHVLVCCNGVFENEKRVLTYSELINLLKVVPCNIYFINTSSEMVNYINSYIKKVDYNYKDHNYNYNEPIYTVKDGCLLKLYVTVNRDVIKKTIDEVYKEEISNIDNVRFLSIEELMDNKELLELYKYPVHEKKGKFVLPNYSYSNPNLYYILSGIYKKDGDSINITKKDLSNLYFANIIRDGSINDIVNNINIDILKKYNLKELSKSIETIDSYKSGENDVHIKLISLKNRIEEARANTKYVNGLGLLKDKKEKNNDNVIKKYVKKEE